MTRRMLAAGVAVVFLQATDAAGADPPNVEFRSEPGRLAVRVGGEPFAVYVHQDDAIPRPYFAHVRLPGGPQVTRNHPPVAGKDPTDHDTFHPGLWLAFGHAHWGLTLGPVTGRLVAEMITGATPFCDPAPYSADRFRH